jgi:hypothetical protein
LPWVIAFIEGVTMGKLSTWLRQPTTVAGISALLGTAMALALGQMSFAAAVPLLTGAAISIVLPDNSVAKQQAAAVAQEIVAQVTAKEGAKA